MSLLYCIKGEGHSRLTIKLAEEVGQISRLGLQRRLATVSHALTSSMRNVYVAVRCPSASLSVCPVDRQQQ